MPRKVKPDANDFNASARTSISSERERQMYALYEEPPHISIKIPFIKAETVDAYAFSILILRFRLRQSIQFLTQNIYFTTGYILSCLVAYNHVRFYYKDQLLSYGLRHELPGIAEQIQTQSVSTFNFATIPLALEKAKQMGRLRSVPPNKLARFAVTPFVNRVDMYRDAAVIQFNTKWVDVLGNNLIRQWYLKPTNTVVGDLTPTIPQMHTISSLPKEEFQSALITQDQWHSRRPFMELADELPTQLEDLFSEPTRRRTKLPRGPLELLRPFDLPRSTAVSGSDTRFQPVQGGELQQWLQLFTTKTLPQYELLHVLPLTDISSPGTDLLSQGPDILVKKLNKKRRYDLVDRIKWQTLVDMTERVKQDTFLQTLQAKQQPALTGPSDQSRFTAEMQRVLKLERDIDRSPTFMRWKWRREKYFNQRLQRYKNRPVKVRVTSKEREAVRTRLDRTAYNEFRDELRRREHRCRDLHDVHLFDLRELKKAYAREHYTPTPFWTFYGQRTVDTTRFNLDNTLFQLTPQEVAELQAGPPGLEIPRPPQNPEDTLPVYAEASHQLSTFKNPSVGGLHLQAFTEFFQKQAQAAGQVMKECMVMLTPRVPGDMPKTMELENRFLTRPHARWSHSLRKAIYDYRRALSRYKRNYGALRADYRDQVQAYKQLIRQSREIRSLWKTTLPMFLAQQMQESYATPQPFIHSPLGQMTPPTWAHASTFAVRMGTPPRSSSLVAEGKLQANPAVLRKRMRFLLRTISDRTTGRAPELKPLYKALPLNQKGAAVSNTESGQFSEVQVQQKIRGWLKDFYSLLSKYNLSKGSTNPGQVSISQAAAHFLELRPLETIIQLDPLTVWVDDLLAGKHSFEKPIGFPAGFEYHWARTMQAYAQAHHRTNPAWLAQKEQTFGKVDALTPQLVTAIWQKINREATEYIDKVHSLQVTPEDCGDFKEALEYAQLLSDIRISHQLRKEIPSLLDSTLGVGYLREYTQALSQYIPSTRPVMHGFLFPDKTYEESQKELQAAQRRYEVLKMSPWGAFKTLFARRPFEVFLPPGWRPFNEAIFSSEEGPGVGVSSMTPWKDLLEDPTTTGIRARPASRLARQIVQRQKRETSLEVRQPRRWYNRLLGRLDKPRDGMLDVLYGPIRTAPQMPTIEALGVRSMETGPSMEEWGINFLLGRGNVLKDRPLTFRGQQNRFDAQTMATAPDQIQLIRAQMGLVPAHRGLASGFYRTSPQIRRAQKRRMPLKRQGYLRLFFRRSNKRQTPAQRTQSWLQTTLAENRYVRYKRRLRWSRRDLCSLNRVQRWQGRIRRYKREQWWDWLNSPLSSGRSMLQPSVDKLLTHSPVRKYRQGLHEGEWHQLTEKALESRAYSPFAVKMPWDAFKARRVNSLRSRNKLWSLRDTSPRVLELVSPKDRLAALMQLTMELTRVTPEVYNEVEYSNIVNTFNYFDQQERFGLHSPFVSHLVMPRSELLPEPTGAPTLLSSSTSDVFTFAQPRWVQAERVIQEKLLHGHYWQGKWEQTMHFVDKLPGVKNGKKLLRPPYYKRNYEPITQYWWCYGGQVVFVIWAFRAYRYALKETWNELVDILFDNFPLQPLREVMNDLGLYDPFTYRIILESPDNFSTSAGSLNKRLFYQTCEVILGLRNLRNGGRSRRYLPKGILFTGVPGTGKTYLVQMLAGATGLPVVTQTASELFDKKTVAMLGLEDSSLTPADQLAFAFDRARELAPCIFFVDEIDALGVTRGTLLTSTGELPDPEHDLVGYTRAFYPGVTDSFKPQMSDEERSARELLARNTVEDLRQDEYKPLTHGSYPGSMRLRTGLLFWHQDKARVAKILRVGTLTEFLVQLDGLRYSSGVLVIGATNRLTSIDPALVRPGRLERVIQLHPLSRRQRIDVLRRQCEKVGTAPAINWRYLANRTRGATAANLATAVNHSAVRAVITGSLHTIETLEYGLDTMTRHKLARQMISMKPLPKISASKTHDPFKFLRIAYYNAGKAIVHNILPDHLSLPYAKLALEPFNPDWTLDELVLKQKTRQQLDSMLIGLYAGKAAEFAMLYRDNPDEEMSALLQLSESDQGSQELAHGTELANAIVDGWYLVEEQRTASSLSVVDNESHRNIRLPVDLETRDALDYWTDNHARLFAHLSAEVDTPEVDTDTKTFTPGLTIHQRHEELAFWALTISRLYMSAVSTRYSNWSKFELRQPWQSERSRFWVPPDLYYHQEPGSLDDFERFVNFVRPQERKTRKNTLKNKQQRTKQWKILSKQWDKARFTNREPEVDSYTMGSRQMVTFPAWEEMDRDYLLQHLVRRAFDAASHIFHDHMELLDRMAAYLLKHRIIREDKIQEIIFEYTVDRYKAKLPLAIPLSDYFEPYGSYRIPQVNIHGAKVPPLIGPIIYVRPADEFERTGNTHYLVYQRAWLSNIPVKRVPLDVFEHTFDPYASRDGWWVKQDHEQELSSDVTSPSAGDSRALE